MPLLIFPLAYLVMEVVVLVMVSQWLGFGWTLLLFFGTSVLGVSLLRRALAKAPERWMAELQRQGVAVQGSAAMQPILIALLLVLPGLVTDLLAGVLAVRNWLRPLPLPSGPTTFEAEYRKDTPPTSGPVVLEAEYRREDDDLKK